ncbi:unnamed protein product [Discula destructiva]
MAYQGGYGAQPPRPPPQRQYPAGQPPPAQQYNQQYGQYQGDYAYDGYGHDQGYASAPAPAPYTDEYVQRGPPPPRDPYGPAPGRGAPGRGPMNGGRGIPRPSTADGQRGGHGPTGPGRPLNGVPQGRGGRPPPFGQPHSDFSMNRPRQPLIQSQKSPGEPGFGDSPFPAFPGRQRKTNLDEEQNILVRMGSLDIDARKQKVRAPTRGPSLDDYSPMPSMDSQRGPLGPPRTYPPQSALDQRRGPPPQQGGYGEYPDPGFGPPSRTMTMPTHMGTPPSMAPPPQRSDSVPYGRGIPPPPRPATSNSHRAPQGVYSRQQGPPPPQAGAYGQQGPPAHPQGGGYGHQAPPPSQGGGYGQQAPPSHSEGGYGYQGYDSAGYYDNGGYYDEYYVDTEANGYPAPNGPSREPEVPNFDAAPARTSLDLALQAGPAQPQRGPSRGPELNKTPVRPGHQPSPQHPDSLPHHPAPVRPGHMPGSMVNKPTPVRNYTGAPVPNPSPAPASVQGSNVQAQSAAAPSAKQQEPPVTSEELERLRNLVKTNSQDQQSALRLAKKLIEAADILVPAVPDPKARGKARERFLIDAQKILKKLSNAQNAEAMFTLADGNGRGLFGGEPDNKDAFSLYQSAAKLGHAAAAYRTAVCCEIGNEEGGGTRKDPLKAMQWYKRAATLGDTPAMYKVGMILLKGLLGQQRNPREAISWLKRAAECADVENPHALHELGLLYESAGPNDVILRDVAYAFSLFKQAADLGYKFSQFRLGCCYEYGLLGCPIDPRLSIMWYSKAAEQGEHQSELALSGWYLTGSDNVLSQNDTEAYLWARKAAMAGLAKAEYAMGYFTEMGIGVPANLEDAKRWYWRAAAQDFPKARERLEELKRSGKNGPRQRERITRSKIGQQNEGECSVM